MKIIVVGCGKIGTTVIASLVKEGHDVVAVDDNPDIISEISDVYDAMCVCGNGTDCKTLTEAGVESTELFVAVTDSDELNMLACFIAKRMGAGHTMARIRNPEYNDQSLVFLRQQLDLSVSINPEYLTARELYHILKLPSAVNVETFSGRNFEMVDLRLKSDSLLNGEKLSDLRKKYDANFLVCAVQREGEVFIPDGNSVLLAGDRISLTAAPGEIQKLLKMLGIMQKQAKNVLILGASTTAFYLAKMLLSGGSSVKIIEKDRKRCLEFSDKLPGAVIIQGDGAQQEVLLEAGLHSVDAFVALTGMDEENILISFFASSQHVTKVISKVNRNELAGMAEDLGLECIVSPQKLISDILSRYARALQNSLGCSVERLYKIMDGKAEALEFNVQQDFKFQQIPIKEINLKDNILIAGIIRGRKTIVPSGEDVILAGDKIIVLATGEQMKDLTDIIRG